MPRSQNLTLGLDLTDREIRAALVEIQDGTPFVRATEAAPLRPGVVEDGVVADEVEVARTLRRLASTMKLGPRVKVVAGLPSNRTSMRILSIPVGPEEEIPTLTEIELEHQGVPLKYGAAGYYLLFRVREGEEMRSVGVMGADPDAIRAASGAVQGSGLSLEAVEPIHSAVLRAAAWRCPTSAATLFLTVGSDITALTYFIGPDIVMTRRIEVGTTSLVLPPNADGADSNILFDPLAIDRLAIESLQMMEYVQRENREELEGVHIVSSDSDMAGLAPMLERRFGLPTTFASCPDAIQDPRFFGAYGLAIRDAETPLDLPRVDLFALERRRSSQRGARRNLWGSMFVSALALVGGFLGCAVYGRPIGALQGQSRRMDALLREVRGQIVAERSAREMHELRDRILRGGGAPLGTIMDYVTGCADSAVRLKSVSVGKNMQVRIDAETFDESALARTTQRLQTTPILSDVNLDEFDRSRTPEGRAIAFVVTGKTADGGQIQWKKGRS